MTAAYRTVWRWHFYAGLFCVPFILWLAITGSIYLFKPQIDAFIDRPYASLAFAPPARSPRAQVVAALTALPGTTLNAYQLPQTPQAATQVLLGHGSDVYRIYVHPKTLRVLKVVAEQERFSNRVSSLHGELLLGNYGSMIVELAASWGIVTIVTGLFLWWPRNASGFGGVLYLRLARGRVVWRDLHGVTGFWVSLFALFFLVSGLPWAASWGGLLAKVRGIGAPAVVKAAWPTGSAGEARARAAENTMPDMPGMSGPRNRAGRPGTPDYHMLDRLVPAVARLGLPFPVLIAPPSQAAPHWTARSQAQDRPLRVEFAFDAPSAAIRTRSGFAQLPVLDRIVAIGVAAHEGQLFAPLNQALGLLVALALVVMSVSAIVLWWSRRPASVLGAPRPLARQRFSTYVVITIAALAIVLPLFGASLVAVLILERALLRRIAPIRHFLGLSADVAGGVRP